MTYVRHVFCICMYLPRQTLHLHYIEMPIDILNCRTTKRHFPLCQSKDKMGLERHLGDRARKMVKELDLGLHRKDEINNKNGQK